MPEPMTTTLQEWERISLKILVEKSYEEITIKEIQFITLTYRKRDKAIHSKCNSIEMNLYDVMQKMISKNNETLNINDKVDILSKLYSAITTWIPIAIIMNVGTYESRQRFINVSLNKILELKIIISHHLPETNIKVMRLYNIFDRLIEMMTAE